ncbi:serine hydrolase [Aquimarina sp. RZ0]|uniref:serine hydrolase domain-containing protein n=1 Tax=Aquimarina sp. RZ0 TaxID=2607730 RepID=UPI0011F0E9A1|nr:serine hydrolase domain-containing protein [Aquimarina sp. RZ0]KAA1244486.1 beta-lactamase family protein [Aquimarina sp. RZ0]
MRNDFTLFTMLLIVITTSFSQNIVGIDSIVRSHYNKNTDVAISVGLMYNEDQHFLSYGTVSREETTKVDEYSIFEIASITKIMTSNLIVQAVLENKIKLTDFIDSYLPKEFILKKEIQHRIKISDLASHQSGLPDLDFRKLIQSNAQQPTADIDLKVLTTMINNCIELIDYGKYRYSTIGYILLGQILETVYGENYDDIIRKKILSPLKMNHTLTKKIDVENKVTGYNPEGGEQQFFEWNIAAPAGLIKSNTHDMLKFIDAILSKKNVVSTAALETEKVFYNDANREMGLGTNIIKDEKNTIYLKTGDSMGQSSILAYNRDKKWGIVIFINQRNHKLRGALLNDIYETILK